MIRNKYALQRLRRNKPKRKKIEISPIHIFTVCILLISFFAATGEAKTVDKPTIITKTKPLFVYSLNRASLAITLVSKTHVEHTETNNYR